MDMIQKLHELHTKEVKPEVFEEVWGESMEDMKQKVMDYVEKFLEAKAERDQKEHKRAKKTEHKATRELDPAAIPAAGIIEESLVDLQRAYRRSSAEQVVEQLRDRAAKNVNDLSLRIKTGRLVAPQTQIGRTANTIGNVKKIKSNDGIVGKTVIKGKKGKLGKTPDGKIAKVPRGPIGGGHKGV